MNERIKELIKSCGIIPEDEHYEVAELIVRECANLCAVPEYYYELPRSTTTDSAYKPRAKTNSECADTILKHFGVE